MMLDALSGKIDGLTGLKLQGRSWGHKSLNTLPSLSLEQENTSATTSQGLIQSPSQSLMHELSFVGSALGWLLQQGERLPWHIEARAPSGYRRSSMRWDLTDG